MPPASDKTLRREGRAAALQMLYAMELNGQPAEQVEGWYAENHPLPLASRQFSHELLHGALTQRPEAEALYSAHLRHWRPERLSVIDRCLLWMAASELLGERFVPLPVLVDEYVRLAKRYSRPEAVPFMNAIVEAMTRTRRAAPAAPPS